MHPVTGCPDRARSGPGCVDRYGLRRLIVSSAHRADCRRSAVAFRAMGRNLGWPTGRYQAVCEDGHCALRGGKGRSKLEGQIFTLLDLALGPGISNAPVDTARGRFEVDMLFPFVGGGVVVEYDGAYFHLDRIERDAYKSSAI